MKSKAKNRIFSIIALVLMIMSSGLFVVRSYAQNEGNVPVINKIVDVRSNSIVLPIKSDIFKDSDAVALITIKRPGSAAASTREVNVHFNENGIANVNISGLNSGTRYELKVSLKGSENADFSPESNTEEVMMLTQ